jgi:hypothetical protein
VTTAGATLVRVTTYIPPSASGGDVCVYGRNMVGTLSLRTLSYFVSPTTPAISVSTLKTFTRRPRGDWFPNNAAAAAWLITMMRGDSVRSRASMLRPAISGIPIVAK